jgi:plasmid stabilization system protein ParE
MTCIVWTEPAVCDLDSIHAYIARDTEVYADAVVTEIFGAVDHLARFPQSGRVVPEVDNMRTQERSSSETTA